MLLDVSLCLYPKRGVSKSNNQKHIDTHWKASELTNGGICGDGCKSNGLDYVVVSAEFHLRLAVHRVSHSGGLRGHHRIKMRLRR